MLQRNQIIEHHIVPTLAVSSDYIRERFGITAIMRTSLLYLINQAASDDSILSQMLLCIFSGNISQIGTATVRVPAFAEITQLKSPEHGYRQLGNIPNHNSFQLQAVPHHLDQQNEIFAADPDHPKSQAYAKIWQMYGVKMDSHFIHIFNLLQNPPTTSLSGSPASRNSPFGSLPPHPDSSVSLSSFLQQAENTQLLQNSHSMASPTENYLSTSSVYNFFSVYHLN